MSHTTPPFEQWKPVNLPEDDDKTGDAMILRMVRASRDSLPKESQTLSKLTKVSTSDRHHNPDMPITTVCYSAESKHLELPLDLLAMEWDQSCYPSLNGCKSLNEAGIGAACSSSYECVATILKGQLSLVKPRFDLSVNSQLQVSAHGRQQTDISIVCLGDPRSHIEHKHTFGEGGKVFKKFPFDGLSDSAALENLAAPPKHLLEQAIDYAGKSRGEPACQKVLMAIALPPLKFYFIVVDFGSETLTVFPNAVKYERLLTQDGKPAIGDMIVDPDAWCAYWKVALWFFILVVAFNYEDTMAKAVKEQQIFNHVYEKDVLLAIKVLGETPRPSFWVRLSLWEAQLFRLARSICMPWVTLLWQILRPPNVLKWTRYLTIPRLGTLNIRDESDFVYSWRIAILPDCKPWWTHTGTKRFYVYPKLNLFVKVFSSEASEAFEAEVKIFNSLSEIQGAGIPKLYASGKVIGGSEFCLVMSYEGEPLEHWNAHDQRRVEKLVTLLHQYQVHHHDIAPRNVVVDRAGKFTLIDFDKSEEFCSDDFCTEGVDLGMREEEDELADL